MRWGDQEIFSAVAALPDVTSQDLTWKSDFASGGLLAGHSLGGIRAADMAADPATKAEYNIQSVVTYGSPIARFHIPHDVSVLSVEHREDLVPKLDGRPNPDTPNWTTITTDSLNGNGPIGQAHDKGAAGYGSTLTDLDRGNDLAHGVRQGVEFWKDQNRAFFGDQKPSGDDHQLFALDYHK